MGEWINGKKIIQAYNVIVGNDIYSVPWTPYHDTSTIVGWDSYVSKEIYYKALGKLVFVEFSIDGNSDNIATTFTLPFTSSNTIHSHVVIWIKDSATWQVGRIYLPKNSNMVHFYVGLATNWAATGGKTIIGQFTYEAA